MKFFVDMVHQDMTDEQFEADGGADNLHKTVAEAAFSAASDGGDLWAYEGVVLPGGEVVVGRWWHPREAGDDGIAYEYSGPFMFWCVDH